MDPATATVIVAALGCLASVATAWFAAGAKNAAHGAKREATRAKAEATTAAENSSPVSNGFTAEVRTKLAEILAGVSEARDAAASAEGKIDAHLEAHANGHVIPFVAAREARR